MTLTNTLYPGHDWVYHYTAQKNRPILRAGARAGGRWITSKHDLDLHTWQAPYGNQSDHVPLI